jgi:hypothetical protein
LAEQDLWKEKTREAYDNKLLQWYETTSTTGSPLCQPGLRHSPPDKL